ncbi:hypothetical protein CMEL01_04023 [Colletotrichum melonis]|uniref:Uncharacterized protein n=1 Tax=Colletotrichum melonis TaxID=1209925 RepID=A0AAI9UBE3_9PEZI|nr:hypothetical protein CMEL01_04023 [Colletotrichum melonis]
MFRVASRGLGPNYTTPRPIDTANGLYSQSSIVILMCLIRCE